MEEKGGSGLGWWFEGKGGGGGGREGREEGWREMRGRRALWWGGACGVREDVRGRSLTFCTFEGPTRLMGHISEPICLGLILQEQWATSGTQNLGAPCN